MRGFELVVEKEDQNGIVKKDGATVYEKTPIIKHVPNSYFHEVSDTKKLVKKKAVKGKGTSTQGRIHIPTENEILDICNEGEDQLYEFKAPGVKMEVISEEVAAFLHTKNGGILFYGIDDGGTVIGSDMPKQDFDQRIQNSIRNTISPSPHIELAKKSIMGSEVILVIIPPWDRKSLYLYTKKERYLIRKGTNKFALQPNELKKLADGKTIA
jgi:hypothetical protein